MPTFAYKARNPQGTVVSGNISAKNEQDFRDKLKQQNLVLVSLQKQGGFDLQKIIDLLNKKGVTTKDITVFCRQFSVMVNAGLPFLTGLNVIADSAENKSFGDILRKIRDDISGGSTLGDAMAKHPKVFDNLFVNMVRSGEAGGVLDQIMERLSIYLEKAEALKAKIKGAMMYPIVVMTIASGVVIFLLVAVVPTFKSVFESFHHELPMPTQILIAVSEGIAHYILYAFGVIIVLAFLYRTYAKTPKGRYNIDSVFLKLPVFGSLLRKSAVAKFTRTLGTLLKSGVPVTEALDTVAKTAGNAVVEKAILDTKEAVRRGEEMSEPLKKSQVFPPMVISMISIGQETGALDEMLVKVADFYEAEVDTAVEGLTALIEPIVIVFLGITIGSIVVAMFMPMFDLGNLVGE